MYICNCTILLTNKHLIYIFVQKGINKIFMLTLPSHEQIFSIYSSKYIILHNKL